MSHCQGHLACCKWPVIQLTCATTRVSKRGGSHSPTTLFWYLWLHWGNPNKWLVCMLVGHACSFVSDAAAWSNNCVVSGESCHSSIKSCWNMEKPADPGCVSHVIAWPQHCRRVLEACQQYQTQAFCLSDLLGQFLLSRGSISIGFSFSCWLWAHGIIATNLRNHLKESNQITNKEAHAVRSLENALAPLLPSRSQRNVFIYVQRFIWPAYYNIYRCSCHDSDMQEST